MIIGFDFHGFNVFNDSRALQESAIGEWRISGRSWFTVTGYSVLSVLPKQPGDGVSHERLAVLAPEFAYVLRVREPDAAGAAEKEHWQIPGHTATCGKIGAVVKVSVGVWPAGVVVLPNDRVVFGGAEEAVLIQRFPPLPKGETGTIEITYSPPGACCLPTPLLFVPHEP